MTRIVSFPRALRRIARGRLRRIGQEQVRRTGHVTVRQASMT